MLAVFLRRRDRARIGVAHARIVVVARECPCRRSDRWCRTAPCRRPRRRRSRRRDRVDRLGALELHDHHGGVVERRVELARRHGCGTGVARSTLAKPRSPCGGYFAARTISRACAALRTSGAMMPSAPPSSTRWISSTCATRTSGAIPQRRAPRSRSGSWSRATARNAPDRCRASRSPRSRRLRDLDRAREPHRHRGRDLAAREPLLQAVATFRS